MLESLKKVARRLGRNIGDDVAVLVAGVKQLYLDVHAVIGYESINLREHARDVVMDVKTTKGQPSVPKRTGLLVTAPYELDELNRARHTRGVICRNGCQVSSRRRQDTIPRREAGRIEMVPRFVLLSRWLGR